MQTQLQEPIHIISLGAGVQSSTMSLMAAFGEITPMPKAAIFADTQAEPKSVYIWLDWLEKQLPFPVHRVTAGNLAMASLRIRLSGKSGKHYQSSGIPMFVSKPDGGRGPLLRKCTRDFKISPLQKFSRTFAKVKRGEKNLKVIQWIGISLDECHRKKPHSEPWGENRWPLIEKAMTRQDCLAWMTTKGLPAPPRSACFFCPYHNDREWERLRIEEPSEFQKAVDFEKAYQNVAQKDEVIRGVPFLHASCKPIDQVQFKPKDAPAVSFGQECEGMCGV